MSMRDIFFGLFAAVGIAAIVAPDAVHSIFSREPAHQLVSSDCATIVPALPD